MSAFDDSFNENNPVLAAQRKRTAEYLAQVLGSWLSLPPGVLAGDEEPLSKESLTQTEAAPDSLIGLLQDRLKPVLDDQRVVPSDPKMMGPFLQGLKAYKAHSTVRAAPPVKIVWQQGTTVLRDYGSGKPDDPAVFVVPSLINRFDILDLEPGHSLLRTLASRGLRPLVLDWGEPGEEEKNFSVTDYIMKRIIPAAEFLIPRVANGQLRVIGYCMGGLLALAMTVLRPELANKLVLMATPWNFSAALFPGTPLSTGEAFLQMADQIEPHLAQHGCFPAEGLQIFFACVQPLQVLEKFARFAGFDPQSIEAQRFVLSEDWVNGGVPLAAPVARESLRAWYGENRPGKILWRAADVLIDPRLVKCPAMIITPAKDRLVPPESARPLARLIRGAVIHEPQLGHIGLLASHAAPQEVWEPLARWLARG